MTALVIFVLVGLVCLLAITYLWGNRLEKKVAASEIELERMKDHYESERSRVYAEAKDATLKAQALIDQQRAEISVESDRLREHHEAEARRFQAESEKGLAQLRAELELLRKYESLKTSEIDAQKALSDAIEEANKLRAEAKALWDKTRTAADEEKTAAVLNVKDIHEQADARLNQALKDAGRIISEAENRAKEIAGEAYTALQEKKNLEKAAEAMRNIVEGYGDRYLIPTHSLLDDLAAEYGYDAAGRSLASAREQARKMVELGEAAACDYVETHRRNTAIQFVVHAFNGSVDSILSRVKSDNYGTLEQQIKDSFGIVNREGSAFRNARILETYLGARLEELKWAVIVQELAQRDREEQRFLKEQERDRQKAEQERLRQLKEAEKERELLRAAMEEAEKRVAAATAEQRQASELELQKLKDQLEEATRKELTIAQQTQKGFIYVISNIGSFGDGVYKIGMTRRAAQERVDELGDASVPFEFDIHGVIETENAPALEFRIHQAFLERRMNKVNMRKEFFRIDLVDIMREVETLEHGKDFSGSVIWTEKARAHQYFESLSIEKDPDARKKWLDRCKAVAERRERYRFRQSPGNGQANGASQEGDGGAEVEGVSTESTESSESDREQS